MKSLPMLCAAALLSSIACSDQQPDDLPTSSYAGYVVYYSLSIHGVVHDTSVYPLDLTIAGAQFARQNGCSGIATFLTNNSLELEGNDCACWCDCSPLVDCVGDPVLGRLYAVTLPDGTELLSSEPDGVDETLANGGVSGGTFSPGLYKYIRLEKQ